MGRFVLSVILVSCLVALAFAKVSLETRKNALQVENGSHVINDGTLITIQQPSGNTTYMKVPTLEQPESLSKRYPTFPDNGWQTSFWAFGNSYTYVFGYWYVPNAPPVWSNQIIFFFNSLENNGGSEIIQPVLQWNQGGAPCSNCWTMSSWYVIGSSGVYSAFVPVSSGALIYGLLTLSGGTWYIYGYVNGVLTTTLTVASATVGVQPWAQAMVLEAYNINGCNYYPSPGSLTVYDVILYDNGVYIPSPTWYLETWGNMCGCSGYLTSASQMTLTF